jgi:hypothetical protein
MRKTFIALFVLSILANGLLVQQSKVTITSDLIINKASDLMANYLPQKKDPRILLEENLVAQKALAIATELEVKQRVEKALAEQKKVTRKKHKTVTTKKELRKIAPKSVLHAYAVSLTSEKTKNEISLNVKGVANESFGVYIISKQGKVEAFYEFAANTASERKMALNISHLDKGTYFAHLVSNGDRVVKKFVKA